MSLGSLEIPEGNKLVQFHMTVSNTSDETYEIFKDDFQMQWGDGDDDFGIAMVSAYDGYVPH